MPQPSHFQSDGTHEFQGVAFFDHTVAQLVIEVDFSILQVILKMDIVNSWPDSVGKGCEGQIVGGDQSDGVALEQGFDHAERADFAVMGIGSVENLIEQKEHGGACIQEASRIALPMVQRGERPVRIGCIHLGIAQSIVGRCTNAEHQCALDADGAARINGREGNSSSRLIS